MSTSTVAAAGRVLAHRGISGWNSAQPISLPKTLPTAHSDDLTYFPVLDVVGRTAFVSAPRARVLPPVVRNPLLEIVPNAAPLEIWEGVVTAVDPISKTMQTTLNACSSRMPSHTAEFDLEWVSEQDLDLVKPGAVFYLTLFKRTRPSLENAQELRFRRRPAWTQGELDKVFSQARELREKGRVAPIAE